MRLTSDARIAAYRAQGWWGDLTIDDLTQRNRREVPERPALVDPPNRAALDGAYTGPGYSQEGWVAAHGYAEQDWETLLRWWQVEHDILASIVDRIPKERLAAECTVGGDAPVTLRFLIEDYLAHQRWHFAQLTDGVTG